MRRVAAAGLALGMILVPTSAQADPVCSGLTCLDIEDGEAVVTGPGGINLSLPVPTKTVEKPVPGPTATVTVPQPGPTQTVTLPRETVTRTKTQTAAPVTITTTPTTVTKTATVVKERLHISPSPVRQSADPSGIVVPTLAAPPKAGINLIPDTPGEAAATFSILGLIAGIGIGVLALYVVHRRARRVGRLEGEEEANAEFYDAITDYPTEEIPVQRGPKHRAN